MPCRHRIEIHHVRANPPVATVDVNFCFSGNMTVVFTCKLIHLFDDLFRASHLDHRLPEGLVADVSVVDAIILLFATFPCKLIRRIISFASKCFSIPVTVWSVLSDVEVRYGERVKHS